MAFIKKSEMKKKVLAVTIAEHPLLKTSDVDTSVKMAYLQGCTLAALFDDAEMSEDEKNRLTNIGLSLRLSENEISEAMSTVMSLTEDERVPFVDEIVSVLRVDPVADFFMDDFESIMSVNGKICGEGAEGLDFVGSLIYKDENWKVVRKKKQDAVRKEKERIEAAAAKKAAEEKAAKEKAEADRRKKEAEKHAKELNAKFFHRANELLSDYFNDNPLPAAAWRKMLALREEGFDVVDIGEVIKSFQSEYDKAEAEWHELQGNYSYRVVKSARIAISKRLAMATSALCGVKKDLSQTDISSLNRLKKISHGECGCFKMMGEIKKRIKAILGADVLKSNYDELGELGEIISELDGAGVFDGNAFLKGFMTKGACRK